jgi:hypothetical protein
MHEDGKRKRKCESEQGGEGMKKEEEGGDEEGEKESSAPKLLRRYEQQAYELASEFEEGMVRF